MRRKNTLLGSIIYLIYLYAARRSKRARLMGALFGILLLGGAYLLFAAPTQTPAAAAEAAAWRPCPKPLRVATFNIENFPQSEQQVEGAFKLIKSLKVPVIGVQEITDAPRFEQEAQKRLGKHWQFAHLKPGDVPNPPDNRPRQLQGVLFDGEHYTLRSITRHDDTRVDANGRPTFEALLAPKQRGEPLLRVLVVHLKAGGDGRPIRAKQYKALRGLVERVHSADATLILLGDFNATHADDFVDLAWLARVTTLSWTTEKVACSAFWRRDKDCPVSRLDHILSSRPAKEATPEGACRTHGCKDRDRCPTESHTISDHCPVVATFR